MSESYYIDLPLPGDLAAKMKATQQNPRYHAEGDVYAHTSLVVTKFKELHPQFELTPAENEILYWACVLHDIGKPEVTKFEDGRWTSPGHEAAGVPIARNILLQHPEISATSRQQILNLVRWHGMPLKWARLHESIDQIKLLGTQTDLRLLSIFTWFDFFGRISDDAGSMRERMRVYREEEVPRAEYELAPFAELMRRYDAWTLKQKNAAWNALRLGRSDLIEKLLDSSPRSDDNSQPPRKVIFTYGPPLSGKSYWLRENYPDAFTVQLSEHFPFNPGTADKFKVDRHVVEFKYMMDNYMRQNPLVILDGQNTSGELRMSVNNFLRNMNTEITYLIFETGWDSIRQRNSLAESPMDESDLAAAYSAQELIHPWEAHITGYIQGE